MKKQIYRLDDRPVGEQPLANHNTNAAEIAFVPCPGEVTRKAYFSYVNEGSPEGRDVQHWLNAEAGLIKESNRTRIHGLHN